MTQYQLTTASKMPVRIGDIRRLSTPFGLARSNQLGLIVALEPARGVAEIMLVHDNVGNRSKSDYVIQRSTDTQTMHYVIQTRARGIIWLLQCEELVARLDPSETQSLVSSRSATNPDETRRENEPHKDDQVTSIRAFKQDQLQTLRMLCEDCTDTLLDEQDAWRLDPRIMEPAFVAAKKNPTEYLGRLMHILNTHKLVATPDDIQRLHAVDAFKRTTWRNILGERTLIPALLNGATELINSAISTPIRDDKHPQLSSPIDDVELVAADSKIRVASVVGIISDALLWIDHLSSNTDETSTTQIPDVPVFLQPIDGLTQSDSADAQ